MGISLLSISHQNAPLVVRELFAFPEHVQEDLMKQMLERGFAAESSSAPVIERKSIRSPSVKKVILRICRTCFWSLPKHRMRNISEITSVSTAERRQSGICSMWQQDWIPWLWVRIRFSVR